MQASMDRRMGIGWFSVSRCMGHCTMGTKPLLTSMGNPPWSLKVPVFHLPEHLPEHCIGIQLIVASAHSTRTSV